MKKIHSDSKEKAFSVLVSLYLLLTCNQTLVFGTNGSTLFQLLFVVNLVILCTLLLAMTIRDMRSINKYLVLSLLVVFCLIMMTCLLRDDFDYKNFFEVFVLVTAILLSCYFPLKWFCYGFYKSVLYISIFSIIFFILGLVFPQIFSIFPRVINSIGIRFRFTFFSVLPESHLGSFALRNYGPFREPGVFVCYITFAYIIGMKNRLIQNKHAVVFILAIITTLSAAGYLIAVFLFVAQLVEKKRIKQTSIFLIIFILLFLILKIKTNLFDFDGPVLIKYMGESGSADARYSSFEKNFNILMRYPIFGSGWKKSMEMFSGFGGVDHNTNTFLFFFSCYGIVVGTLYTVGLFSFFKVRDSVTQSLLLLGAVFLVLASQRLVFDINIQCFIVYGLSSLGISNQDLSYKNSKKSLAVIY